jgi:hypothetical protein
MIRSGIGNSFTLRLLINEIENDTWFGTTLITRPSRMNYKAIKKKLLWSPKQHQSEYIEYYDLMLPKYRLNGSLFAAAPGAGKTYTALAIAEGLEFERIIVVSPKPALYAPWVKSLDELYHKREPGWSSLEKRQPNNNDRFLIVHYEYIGKLVHHLKHLRATRTLVVLDESHNLNNLKSRRTSEFMSLCKEYATEILFLSGTPIKATATEVIPLLKVVDPYFNSGAEEIFKKLFRAKSDNLYKLLHHRLGFVSKVVGKAEVMSKKPTTHVQTVKFNGSHEFTLESISKQMEAYIKDKVPLYQETRPEALETFYALIKSVKHNEHYRAYKSNLNEIITSNTYYHLADEMAFCTAYEKEVIYPQLNMSDKRTWKEIKALAKYPSLKVRGECLGRVLGRARIDCNIAIARNINYGDIIETSESKTLIFSNSVEVVQAAAEACSPYISMQIYGEHTKNLKTHLHTLETKPSINPLITTFASLSTAVPLVMCSTVLIIDSPFRDYILNQAIARVDRLGQTKSVNVWFIKLDTGDKININDRSLDLARWSADEVSKIMNVENSTPYGDPLEKMSDLSDIVEIIGPGGLIDPTKIKGWLGYGASDSLEDELIQGVTDETKKLSHSNKPIYTDW